MYNDQIKKGFYAIFQVDVMEFADTAIGFKATDFLLHFFQIESAKIISKKTNLNRLIKKKFGKAGLNVIKAIVEWEQDYVKPENKNTHLIGLTGKQTYWILQRDSRLKFASKVWLEVEGIVSYPYAIRKGDGIWYIDHLPTGYFAGRSRLKKECQQRLSLLKEANLFDIDYGIATQDQLNEMGRILWGRNL